MTSDEDPLANVQVGETRRLSGTVELDPINFVYPEEFRGSDRWVDRAEVTDAQVVSVDGKQVVEVTFDGEVTKRLPRNWNRVQNAPREQATEDSRDWPHLIARAAAIIVPFGIVAAVATYITNAAVANMTVNGQPIEPVGTGDVLVLMGMVLVIVTILYYGMGGGFPGKAGGAR